jgi:hypothetical protein
VRCRGQSELFAFPALQGPISAAGARLDAAFQDGFTHCTLTSAARQVSLSVTHHVSGDAEISFSPGIIGGLADVLLSIEYEGDVGNAFIDGTLVAVDFSNGQPWEIGLARFASDLERKGMYIHVTPRREGTMMVRESGMAFQQELRGRDGMPPGAAEVAIIRRISAQPILEIVVRAG